MSLTLISGDATAAAAGPGITTAVEAAGASRRTAVLAR
jgi:hypothetical protein